jgi:hypothetical protein
MVQTYTPYMSEVTCGDYVLKSDYDALTAELNRLNRFCDFLCRQDWTSRGRAIAEEAFDNDVRMDAAAKETACDHAWDELWSKDKAACIKCGAERPTVNRGGVK